MSSTLGKNLEISIFGESHGEAVGVTINGLPSGETVDMELINEYLYRRSTGRDLTMSQRKEADEVKILSGVYEGKTTGTPLTMVIYNTGQHSKDYSKMSGIARPSHADYTGYMRYHGYNDPRGGGHFSGRLTTPMVMAGALCVSILKSRGIEIIGNILSIDNVSGGSLSHLAQEVDFDRLKQSDFPAIANADRMRERIEQARNDCDSVGGYIECIVKGMPVGVGSPMFDGIENIISKAIFGIPAVKGIEFGENSLLTGIHYNDLPYIDNGKVKTRTNHDGGINGGITNGMPIVFKVKMKPTPSIYAEQNTVDYIKGEDVKLSIEGRHDPCVVVRAVPVVECVTAMAILDMLMEAKIYE